MGLSSNARLLSITARLTNNEYQTQKLANRKLGLATLSHVAQSEYIEALDRNVLMYNTFDSYGAKTSEALTAASMYLYQPCKKQYMLTNAAKQVMVSKTDVQNFEETDNLKSFLDRYHLFDSYNTENAELNAQYQNQYDTEHAQWATQNSSYNTYREALAGYESRRNNHNNVLVPAFEAEKQQYLEDKADFQNTDTYQNWLNECKNINTENETKHNQYLLSSYVYNNIYMPEYMRQYNEYVDYRDNQYPGLKATYDQRQNEIAAWDSARNTYDTVTIPNYNAALNNWTTQQTAKYNADLATYNSEQSALSNWNTQQTNKYNTDLATYNSEQAALSAWNTQQTNKYNTDLTKWQNSGSTTYYKPMEEWLYTCNDFKTLVCSTNTTEACNKAANILGSILQLNTNSSSRTSLGDSINYSYTSTPLSNMPSAFAHVMDEEKCDNSDGVWKSFSYSNVYNGLIYHYYLYNHPDDLKRYDVLAGDYNMWRDTSAPSGTIAYCGELKTLRQKGNDLFYMFNTSTDIDNPIRSYSTDATTLVYALIMDYVNEIDSYLYSSTTTTPDPNTKPILENYLNAPGKPTQTITTKPALENYLNASGKPTQTITTKPELNTYLYAEGRPIKPEWTLGDRPMPIPKPDDPETKNPGPKNPAPQETGELAPTPLPDEPIFDPGNQRWNEILSHDPGEFTETPPAKVFPAGAEPKRQYTDIYTDDKEKAQWYINLWYRMSGQTDVPKLKIKEDSENIIDDEFRNNYLFSLRPDIITNGKNYVTIDANLATNSNWLQNVLSQGIAVLENVDINLDDKNTFRWNDIIHTNISEITTKQDDEYIARAEAKYKKTMEQINFQDQSLQNKMKKLDTEHNALKTEYESIQNMVAKNIERSFKTFS